MPASRAASFAFAAILLIPGPAARGQEAGEPDHIVRWREASAKAAGRLVAFGHWCRGRSYKVLARQQFETALRIDKESSEARTALGHKKEEGAWKAPAIPEPLVEAPATSPAAVTALEREMEKAYAEAAAHIAELATWCSVMGRSAEARATWSDALLLDPARSDARAALELGRADRSWLQSTEEGPEDFTVRCRRIADEGLSEFRMRILKDPALLETGPTADGTKAEEERFTATSTHSKAPARTLVEEMVHTEALWRGLGVVLPREPRPDRLRVDAAASKKEYVALVEAVPDKTPEWKAENRKAGGCWPHGGWLICWGWRPEWIRETVAHDTTHFLFARYAPGKSQWGIQEWLLEGASMLATTTLLGRAQVTCISLKDSAVDRDRPEREDWDARVRDLVLRGEDPPIRDLMAAGWNDMGRSHLLKARSMVQWMALRSPRALRAVLQNSAQETPAESALMKAFGAPPEALERRWRLWIRRP